MHIRTLSLAALSTLAGTLSLQAQSTNQAGTQTSSQASTQTSATLTAQGTATTAPDRPIQVDPATMETMIVSKVAPIYPLEARNAAIEGDVVLYAIVDERGKIKSLDVLSGPEVLRVSALTAVNQWKYAPFIVDEAPVKVGTIITLHFRLSN